MNFANKVLVTGECDVLILDEVLGLLDEHLIEPADILRIIDAKSEEVELILTGRNLCEEIRNRADCISKITAEIPV